MYGFHTQHSLTACKIKHFTAEQTSSNKKKKKNYIKTKHKKEYIEEGSLEHVVCMGRYTAATVTVLLFPLPF